MIKILFKHVKTKSIKSCQEDVARISRIAITAKSTSVPHLSIYSLKEIDNKGRMSNNGRTSASDNIKGGL